MLRAISAIPFESPALELLVSASARKDFYKLIRIKKYSSSAPASQTVLTSEGRRAEGGEPTAPVPPPPPPPPGPPPRRSWTLAAAALALTASLGGVYFYRKLNDEDIQEEVETGGGAEGAAAEPEPAPEPADGALLPRRVDFLLVGGGTASFAALRAIRAARPDAAVLVVGDEPLPPYMRPPLSKEVWREPLAEPDAALPALSFRQWNGKRRPLLYEPLAFYTPVERLEEQGGAGVARGWRVVRLDVERHEAELAAPGRAPVLVQYGRALVAPGVRPRRLEALRAARAAGRSLAVRGARDVTRLARLVDAPSTEHVVLVGGGFLASELAAALAERLGGRGARVTQVFREEAPLADVLPGYLAAEAARRLRGAGVALRARAEVAAAEVRGGAVWLRVRGPAGERELRADVVVECVGAELEPALAAASGLEVAGGALPVTAELQARADVWAAGDAVSWHDVLLGRRSLQHHDHAVASGRRAGENMALPAQRPYTHQPMFWSDLGPDLGLEAIGIIDSSLPTVGVFSEADVKEVAASATSSAEATSATGAASATSATGATSSTEATSAMDAASAEGAILAPTLAAGERSYERGVVFYTREKRVVGILLWNLFNRMHVARQVLAHGEFEDLFEVAKLFSLHEEN